VFRIAQQYCPLAFKVYGCQSSQEGEPLLR
jgi:hypothetical protein